MPDVTRSTAPDAEDPFAARPSNHDSPSVVDLADGTRVIGKDPHDTDPNVVTETRAIMLAQHATFVQGGFSTPEVEKARAEKQLAQSPGSIDWQLMAAEVGEAMIAKAHDLADQQEHDMVLDLAKVRRYKELRSAQAASEAEAKAIKDEANALEVELVEMFSEAGMQNVNIDGKTVYLHRSIFAQRAPGVDTDDLKAALIASGHSDLITETINASTLSAWVRELTEDDDAEGLPPEMDGILEAGERYGVRIIAGGTKAKSKTHSK